MLNPQTAGSYIASGYRAYSARVKLIGNPKDDTREAVLRESRHLNAPTTATGFGCNGSDRGGPENLHLGESLLGNGTLSRSCRLDFSALQCVTESVIDRDRKRSTDAIECLALSERDATAYLCTENAFSLRNKSLYLK